ncbi:hypothetical protein AAVH_21199 [Aphelenchoides avenae]|nr:hypothetical protein AAVH_21199 [Aphelenchus avenae]
MLNASKGLVLQQALLQRTLATSSALGNPGVLEKARQKGAEMLRMSIEKAEEMEEKLHEKNKGRENKKLPEELLNNPEAYMARESAEIEAQQRLQKEKESKPNPFPNPYDTQR